MIIKESVFVAIPVYRDLPLKFVQCLKELVQFAPSLFRQVEIYELPGDALLPRARNRIARNFLSTGADVLMMIDSDVLFKPEDIVRVLSHGEGVVGGLYPTRDGAGRQMVDRLPHGGKTQGELAEVRAAGTGFLSVRREVLESLKDGREYETDDGEDGDRAWDFFPVGIETQSGRRRYLSEDWGFCHIAREAGWTVWADRSVNLRHIGEAVY